MKPLSIEKQFMGNVDSAATGRSMPKRLHSAPDMVKVMRQLSFNEAYDFMRLVIATLVERGEAKIAVDTFRELASTLHPDGVDESDISRVDRDLYAAVKQLHAALFIETDEADEALVEAASLLNTLAQEPRRKDEPFLVVLAALLYDIAFIHSDRGQYKQAERELEKSMKLFERLAKTRPERYGAAHILALNASTSVYRSRVKQVNLLAHNQVATSTYLDMLNAGIEDAADRLIDSLTTEGRTLAQMGRHREAVQYFSRALKYLTKIYPTFSLRQLQLSIDLGESLLNVAVSREKGIHLLNTMLHKATKLNAEAEHRRIVDILLNAKNRRLDILGIWHKVFPR